MRKLLLFVAVGALAGVASAGDDAAKKEMKKLEGSWTVVGLEQGGKKEPEDKIKGMKCVFSGGDLKVVVEGKGEEAGTYTLDPSKKPAHIEATFKDKTGKGIYQLKGDELKICFAEPGKDR